MTLDELVTQLRAAYGAQLASVVLYGSAATGEHIPKKSDYNVLVLLDRIEMSALAAASAVARAWRESGNPPPLTMTVSEWHRSSDVFPMEYADILDRHRILYGLPPFTGIVVDHTSLRLQLEQQVMGKLLQLRQGALLAGTESKRQIELLTASVSTIMVLFRAVIRLHGESLHGDNAAIAKRVGQLASLDADPFLRVLRHQRGIEKISRDGSSAVLGAYLTGVEQLDAYLDTFTSQERSL